MTQKSLNVDENEDDDEDEDDDDHDDHSSDDDETIETIGTTGTIERPRFELRPQIVRAEHFVLNKIIFNNLQPHTATHNSIQPHTTTYSKRIWRIVS